jgi:hypothetical protein
MFGSAFGLRLGLGLLRFGFLLSTQLREPSGEFIALG